MTVRRTFLHNLAGGLPAEDERLIGNLFAPDSAATGMHGRAGLIPSKVGNRGLVTQNSNTAFTLEPFRLVIPGSQGNYQGDYVVASDAVQNFTIGAQQAGVSRIDLLVTRVRDTAYTPNEGANDVVTSIVAGTPAASNPVAPALPPNSFLHATITVPPTGQTPTMVQNFVYAVAVGGISPTNPDNLAGSYLGQYRDHPQRGLQRWNGSAWVQSSQPTNAVADTTSTTPGTTGITPGAGFVLADRSLRNCGNGMAFVVCQFAPTGPAAGYDAVGNITNAVCFTVPAAWAPLVNSPLQMLGTGRMMQGYLATDRNARWSATTPGGNIAATETVELGGYYLLADPFVGM